MRGWGWILLLLLLSSLGHPKAQIPRDSWTLRLALSPPAAVAAPLPSSYLGCGLHQT